NFAKIPNRAWMSVTSVPIRPRVWSDESFVRGERYKRHPRGPANQNLVVARPPELPDPLAPSVRNNVRYGSFVTEASGASAIQCPLCSQQRPKALRRRDGRDGANFRLTNRNNVGRFT